VIKYRADLCAVGTTRKALCVIAPAFSQASVAVLTADTSGIKLAHAKSALKHNCILPTQYFKKKKKRISYAQGDAQLKCRHLHT
jgi:hypothetical protein